jgi:hypothetical protein
VQLHQPGNTLAIDMKPLRLQLQGHAPIPIVRPGFLELVQPQHNPLLEFDRRCAAV